MSTYRPQQPFKGMTMAQMKNKWQSMTPAERSRNVETFRSAAKNAPKAKPKAKAAPKPQPKAKPKPSLKIDGSVKATRRKTKYERDVEARDKQATYVVKNDSLLVVKVARMTKSLKLLRLVTLRLSTSSLLLRR